MLKKRFLIIGSFLFCLFLLGVVPRTVLAATSFFVNSNGDGSDGTPGDGTCKVSGFLFFCTLRAAIEEANALAAATSESDYEITFDPSLDPIVLTADLPSVQVANLAISGVAATKTVVDGNNSFAGFSTENGQDVNLTIRDLTVQKCRRNGYGGAVAFYGNTLSIEGVKFSANTSLASFGGAVFYWPATSSDNLTIVDSLFDGNSSNTGGGGLYVVWGNAALTNTTFYGNNTGEFGGAIHFESEVTATLTGLTIVNNENLSTTYGDGGGLYSGSGAVTLANTVIAMNIDHAGVANNDCALAGTLMFTSLGSNLIGDGTGCVGIDSSSDLVGSAGSPLDPQLGVYGFHGGFTETLVPLSTSPLVDAGNNMTCADHDQRGIPRPQTTICDIGAVEYSHCDNGSMDADERGTDCGGSICSPCTCPVPDNRILRVPSGSQVGFWYSSFSNAIFNSGDGDTLRAREDIFFGNVLFGKIPPAVSVTLRGGYDCNSVDNAGYFTRIKGSVTIADQMSVIAENIIVQ